MPETVEFHDIAGLVRGASEGEGLGNRFLAAIRETDAICHVVRAHGDEGVPHPEGGIDPLRDAEIVEAELRQADLETAAARLDRVAKQANSGDKEAVAERDWLEAVVEALRSDEPVRSVAVPERGAGRGAQPARADLEAGPLRRERRRGRDGGAGCAREAGRRAGRRGRRGQRPDRVGAGGAGRRARPRRCAASWASRSPASSA